MKKTHSEKMPTKRNNIKLNIPTKLHKTLLGETGCLSND